MIERKRHDGPLRVWVPGCGTGEEAYSVGMLCFERLQAAEASCNVQIFASDIAAYALSIGRAGVYSEQIVADVSPLRLSQFFSKGERSYVINRELRDAVMFTEQNLLADPPFTRLDLISCRNLLIYLEPEVQQKIIRLFHFALNEGGYLFLGTRETIGGQVGEVGQVGGVGGVGEVELFQPVCKKCRIYRRLGTVRHESLDFPIMPRHSAVRDKRASAYQQVEAAVEPIVSPPEAEGLLLVPSDDPPQPRNCRPRLNGRRHLTRS